MKFKLLLCRKSNFLSPKMYFWRFKTFLICGVVLFSSVLLNNCKTEVGNSNTLIDNPTGSLFDMSYDLEQVTFTKFGDGSAEVNKNLSMVDRVSAVPKVMKQSFLISVFEDGTSEMTVKKLEPDHKDLIINDLYPKDPNGDIQLIKKMRDGTCHAYNAKGVDLLAKETGLHLPSADYTPLIKKIIENKNSVSPSDFEQFLNGNTPAFNKSFSEMEAQGATITHLEGAIFQIDLPVSKQGDNSVSKANFRDEKDFISESIVDTTNKVVLGGSLFKNDKTRVSTFFVKYSVPANKNEKPKAEIVHQEITSDKFSSNKNATVMSDHYYSNQSFKVH